MRKSCFVISLALTVLWAGQAKANLVDNNTSVTAASAGNVTGTAFADTAEAAVYNPAGTTRLADGLYINIGNIFAIKKYSHTDPTGNELFADDPTFLFPNVNLVFKKDKLAIFGTFTVPGGGGTLTYEDGTAAIPFHSKLSSMYLAGTVGAAYLIHDMISVSLGVRVMKAMLSATVEDQSLGGVGLDYEDSAFGYGGIVGINIKPMKELMLSIRWETVTHLDFETSLNEGMLSSAAGFPLENEGVKRDLPALLDIGILYTLMDGKLDLAGSFTYGFNKLASWDANPRSGADEDVYDNGYEINLGVRYAIMDTLKAGVSFRISEPGENGEAFSLFAPHITSYTPGAYVQWEVIKNLMVIVSGSMGIYPEFETNNMLTLDKDLLAFGLGFQYKAL